MIKKLFYIILLIFIISSLKIAASEKKVLINNNHSFVFSDNNIDLTLFTVSFGQKRNKIDLDYSLLNFQNYGFISSIIYVTLFFLIVIPIIGLLSIITGIPFLAIGAYQYSIPSVIEHPPSELLYRNFIIAGSICIGMGSLCLIPWVVYGFMSIKSAAEKDNLKILYKVKKNDLSGVQKEIDDGLDVNKKTAGGDTMLIIAAEKGHADMVKLLIKNGADVDIKNKKRETALVKAIKNHDIDIVKILLENGAVLNYTLYIDLPINYAIENNDLKIIELLIDKGADINNEQYNALTAASNAGNVELVEYFIEKGVHIDPVNAVSTPLIEASKKRHFDIIDILLNNGADINGIDKEGNTPLIAASKYSNTNSYLIEKGADINAVNNLGDTALITACYFNNIDGVKILIENNADLNIKNKKGETARDTAEKYNSFKIIKLLIQAGAE